MKYLLIIGVITLLALSACTTKAPVPVEGDSKTNTQEPIKIGFIGPLTGSAAVFGTSALASAKLAVKEINDAGGIVGRQVVLIPEDGVCAGKDASDSANKLINVDGVLAIIGGLCSAETLSFTGVAEANNVIVISYASSSPRITEAGDYIFRDFPSDAYQGVKAAQLAKNQINANNVGILYRNDEWGVGLKDTFKQSFEESGGKIVAVEAYEVDAQDFRTQLTKIKDKSPDAVYAVGFTKDAQRILKQARDLGLTQPFIGADAAYDAGLFENGGAELEGFIVLGPASVNTSAFEQKVNAEFGIAPVQYSAHAYDAVRILAQAIASAKTTDATAVKDALYKQTLAGVSGDIAFDENGDLARAEYDIVVVKDGAFVPFDVTE
jgi:branched-chain amino acid transport system substrate-binding protein